MWAGPCVQMYITLLKSKIPSPGALGSESWTSSVSNRFVYSIYTSHLHFIVKTKIFCCLGSPWGKAQREVNGCTIFSQNTNGLLGTMAEKSNLFPRVEYGLGVTTADFQGVWGNWLEIDEIFRRVKGPADFNCSRAICFCFRKFPFRILLFFFLLKKRKISPIVRAPSLRSSSGLSSFSPCPSCSRSLSSSSGFLIIRAFHSPN